MMSDGCRVVVQSGLGAAAAPVTYARRHTIRKPIDLLFMSLRKPAHPAVNGAPVRRVSLRLDAGKPDHLAPLLGLVGDELAEIGRRARQQRGAEIGELGLDLRLGQDRLRLA